MRGERLDHLLALSRRRLGSVLATSIEHSNHVRPHRLLERSGPPATTVADSYGEIR